MSQHDYVIENQTFPATRADLNNAFGAIVSQNSGASAPSTTYAYQLWYDTSNNKLKQRNADNDAWIDLFDVNQTTDVATASSTGTFSGDINISGGTSKILFTRSDTETIAGNPLGAIEFAHTDTDDAGTAAKIIGEGDGTAGEGRIAIYTGTPSALTEKMRIDNSGLVGIGTVSPTRALTVESTAIPLRVKSTDTTGNIEIGDSTGSVRIGSSGSGDFKVFTGGAADFSGETQAMSINDQGEVLIGSSVLASATYFTVDAPSGGRAADIYRATSTTTNHICNFVSNVGGTETLQQVMEAGGDIESRTSSFGGTSDRTLKENITDATNQWADIKALEFKNFNFIGDPDRPMLGVIAQDVEAAGMTGLVKTSEETGKMSVKYSVLYMKAVIALQEAMARIETLETEMTSLKARVTALETN
jgi:hypothetical protein